MGNGTSISVFNDPWIPKLPGFRCDLNIANDVNLKVKSLIDSNGSWKENLVRSLVNPIQANAILQIQIHRRGGDDIRYWTESDRGLYSVKSGYHLERNSFPPPPYQSCYSEQKWWILVWKLNLPPKVRIFFMESILGFHSNG